MPICVWHHSAGPTGGPRTWRRFRSSRPPGTARPHSDLRVAPLCWASQEPPKPATVSQFAAPRDGEVSFWFAYDTTSLVLPGAPERGDSFAVRSPQGRRGLILICVSRHSAWSLRSPRKWRQFRSSRPPGVARPHYALRTTPLRWGYHEPTKLASVSQFAALERVPRLAPDLSK